MTEELWISNKDQTLAGQKVMKGQAIKKTGAIHDRLIFNDQSRYAFRHEGGELLECGSDGCTAKFNNLGNLSRHRDIIHKPERDARAIARQAEQRAAREAEERGDTIGGREIVTQKRGPRGAVPYIAPLG